MSSKIEAEIELALKSEISNFPSIKNIEWAHRLMRRIIAIRRRYEIDDNFQRLRQICHHQLCNLHQINHRHLNSIVDTYVDCGDRTERSEAMLISGFYTWTYLLSYQRCIMADGTYDEEGSEEKGIRVTDKFSNFLVRMDYAITLQPMKMIWKIIHQDVKNGKFLVYEDLKDFFGPGFIEGCREPGFEDLPHRSY